MARNDMPQKGFTPTQGPLGSWSLGAGCETYFHAVLTFAGVPSLSIGPVVLAKDPHHGPPTGGSW
jgi:hypothetical protein